jgi:hypothetical protein
MGPIDNGRELFLGAAHRGLDAAVMPIAHPTGHSELDRLGDHRIAETHTLHAPADGESARRHRCYLTRMPGCAPLSRSSRNTPEPSLLAASTMPCDSPKRILRGARLATITTMRPFNCSGS